MNPGAFSPSSSPFKSFHMLHSAFLLCSLRCNILLPNCLVTLSSGRWYVIGIPPPYLQKEFLLCFRKFCFVSIVSFFFFFSSPLVPAFLHYLIIFACLLLLQESFSPQRKPMVSHWNLSDSKSRQVSRTLLSILAVLNNAEVWMVSTRPCIFKSSSSFINLLVSVLRAPIKISIIVTFTFHSLFVFFNSLARSRYLSFFSISFNCTQRSAGITKPIIQ